MPNTQLTMKVTAGVKAFRIWRKDIWTVMEAELPRHMPKAVQRATGNVSTKKKRGVRMRPFALTGTNPTRHSIKLSSPDTPRPQPVITHGKGN